MTCETDGIDEITVKPIAIGFRFSHTLKFEDVNGDPPPGLDFTEAERVIGQFRRSEKDSGEPYATVDTEDGTIIVVDEQTISFVIPKEKTQAIPPNRAVVVDFAWSDGSNWYPIPIRIAWPVVDPVTIPPV